MAAAQMWTVKSALEWTQGYLDRHGDEHPRLSAEWLLCHATGFSRVEIYMNYDRPLDETELAKLREGVLRRGRGEPLQYVTGEMAFRHLVLKCAPGVLIPRPETEVLVDCVLEYLDELRGRRPEAVAACEEALAARRALRCGSAEGSAESAEPPSGEGLEAIRSGLRSDGGVPDEVSDDGLDDTPGTAASGEGGEADAEAAPDASRVDPDGDAEDVPCWARVLEIGTGTGCIALSIAGERPGVRVRATDISAAAIDLATRNRDALGQEGWVDLHLADLSDGVPGAIDAQFDVLVSNPPYIPSELVDRLPHEVEGFEPRLALDGGPDGLDVFRAIVERAVWALRPGGLLACELHEDCLGAAASEATVLAAFEDVRIVKDLAGRDRILLATLRG